VKYITSLLFVDAFVSPFLFFEIEEKFFNRPENRLVADFFELGTH